jgi:hypothetical protein
LLHEDTKTLDLPPRVARAFVEDMRAFFAEDNVINRDAPLSPASLRT